MACPSSYSSRPGPSREEAARGIKKIVRNARGFAENEARSECSEIERKAQQTRSVQKRVQFIQNSIEEVEIKLSEEKRYIEKNEEVNDPEAAHRYLESLALTVRKLRALLEREKLLAAGVNCTNVADENCTLHPPERG